MESFGKAQPVKRVEDVRFLTGAGRYVDDIAPEGALHAVMVRSPVAHAEITGLDLSQARAAPGVHAVLAAPDIEAMGLSLGMGFSTVKNQDGSPGAAPERPFLARGVMRFVGEPVAICVAETLAQARDAAELVELDYAERAVHVDLAPGGTALHPEAPENLAFDFAKGDAAATEAAFARAAHVVSLEIEDNRIICNPMEPRGAYAEYDGDRLHVCFGGQGVWGLKRELCTLFGLDAERVRVSNPDVGGGFGMKGMNYPEYFAIAAAAMMLERSVRWMSERGEGMLTDNAGRDLVSTAALAFDDDCRVTAYRIENICNLGAYNSNFGQLIQSELFSRVLTGPYDIQTTWLRTRGIYTNTAQVDAYRGAGRPEAIFALERVMDQAARELRVDPWELRRRNFIDAGAFPYLSATGETYDSGDFAGLLDKAEIRADRAGFAARKAASAAAGKLRGIGLGYYIESILGAPDEGVAVIFHEDGSASIHVGTQSNGQGHETVFAQFLSDQTGIPAERITVVQGDSDLIAQGGGTGGSRSVTVQSNATLATAKTMIERFAQFLADELGIERGAVSFDDERFRVAGSNESPGMLELAARARAAGRADLLRFEGRETLPGRSYPNGAHVAEVEIDPETGQTRIVRYTVVDDFGNLINPMLAEGQVHGGVAQGLGQALCERVVHDEDGQLLTATFMDYAMPRADMVPMIGFSTAPVPSTANPMGMKGCGEAGTVGALGAIGNAVLDALWERGVRRADMPYTPARVWAMLEAAR
ncbi:xanthine dehydrogenase family protein molybdopterin-binding subunit [Profundibacterium mesophilum]|uniref:Xanthine dehydrogenase molybdenum binding subunit apoprotein n=1 Tax=Profundibacterium mesophilum KAUST100406-0324 TaxID=1037889 RepID=A0A921NQV9_9RHOB|nr:xanthine dehydrogenase family protein molybdopterin-binding subunit [Profundibacterium mesophilum]KAF0676762.1 Xanthine dehydrogenase molybdenum binding subunit apoprotein [Profundibacterium mesophilum KAUST100406-0324]